MIPPHNTFTFVFPAPLPPSKKEKHILYSCFLITWPLIGQVQKAGGNMHIEEELCTKLFYYVYLCKWHIRLFKKVSVAPPLIALWSVLLPGYMHGEWQRAKSLIGFIQKLSKKGNGGFIVLLWHSSKLKMREWWILQSLANIIYIPVSMLMNFGCLRLRWTALSRLSPSSSFILLYLIFSTLNIK